MGRSRSLRSRNLRRISIASVMLAALTLGVAAPSASASARNRDTSPVVLAALGDSYSSGVGTPDPDPSVPACYRTPHAWPNLVGAALHWQVENLACSGAETTNITVPFGGQGAQTDLLAALSPRPKVVTITVGGNDIGFGAVLGTCFVSDCRTAVAVSGVAVLTVLPGRLAATYRAVRAAAPDARLVVVGYPQLFPAHRSAVTGCPWLTNGERRAFDYAGELLNAVIAVQAWLAGAVYVDVSRTLEGHELCTTDPWFVPLPAFGAAHPTVEGQQAIAAAVTDRLSRLRLTR
jgi:lysophospholipase L1-like esterase